MWKRCVSSLNLNKLSRLPTIFSGTVADAIREKAELAAQADRLEEIGERLHFAIQAEPEGFGHAIYCARDFAAGEPVIILLGDHLYISESGVSCAKQLADVYTQVGQSVTSLDLCHESELSLNGIVHGSPAVQSPRMFYINHKFPKSPQVRSHRNTSASKAYPINSTSATSASTSSPLSFLTFWITTTDTKL